MEDSDWCRLRNKEKLKKKKREENRQNGSDDGCQADGIIGLTGPGA